MSDRVVLVTERGWFVLLPQCPVATSSQLAEIYTSVVDLRSGVAVREDLNCPKNPNLCMQSNKIVSFGGNSSHL